MIISRVSIPLLCDLVRLLFTSPLGLAEVIERKGKGRNGRPEPSPSGATTLDGEDSTIVDGMEGDEYGNIGEQGDVDLPNVGVAMEGDLSAGRSPTPPTPARDEEHGYRASSLREEVDADDNMSVDERSDVTVETPPRPPT